MYFPVKSGSALWWVDSGDLLQNSLPQTVSPVPSSVNRVSVIDQIATVVRNGILDGEWSVGWLPGERRLSEDLGVGRNSLRAALRILEAEDIIEIIPKQGVRIARRTPRPVTRGKHVVGLLSPAPIETVYPRKILYINALRDQLAKDGYILNYYYGNQYLRTGSEKAMRRLVEKEQCDCWMLVASNKVVQNWFWRNNISCLIAGSCHKGIELPFVDIDYKALCRHAVLTLRRLGHRNIVYLTPTPELAGDIQSETGFLEGLEGTVGDNPVEGNILYLDPNVDHAVHAVNRLMEKHSRPTALLVNNAFQYLTVFNALIQRGLRVPNDVSLICRGSENFLSYLKPSPARYEQSAIQFAGKLFRNIKKLIHNPSIKPKSISLTPEFVEGGSITYPEPE